MTGAVVWLTGLSGAGKSTVAGAVRDRLASTGRNPVLLDGDALRAILPVTPGYEPAERRRLGRFYGALARDLAEQGHLVICATVSLFHEVHAWNRRNIARYLEVWLRVPVAELSERAGRADLYRGAVTSVVGVDTAAEFPVEPDLVIGNYGTRTPEQAADQVVAALDRW
jgi:cytidine diphosphoramidate kinase